MMQERNKGGGLCEIRSWTEEMIEPLALIDLIKKRRMTIKICRDVVGEIKK